MRPIDLSLSASQHNPDYKLLPGHKAVITAVKTDGEYVVTGAKNGELKVMSFNVYKSELNRGPNCITIKN